MGVSSSRAQSALRPPFNDETSAPGGLDIWFYYSYLPFFLIQFFVTGLCFVRSSFMYVSPCSAENDVPSSHVLILYLQL